MPPRAISVEIVSSSRSRNNFHQQFIRDVRNEILEGLERNQYWLRAVVAQDGNEFIYSHEHFYPTMPADNPPWRRRYYNRSRRRIRFPDNVSFTFLGRYGLPPDSHEQRERIGAVIISVMVYHVDFDSNDVVYYRSSYRVTDTRPRIQNTYNYPLTSWRLQNQAT